MVYAKPPFGGPEQVLKYLARYTHRVAISNSRLVKVEDGAVHFTWKDYAHGNAEKEMALPVFEFIRRFLLHVLPRGLCDPALRLAGQPQPGSKAPAVPRTAEGCRLGARRASLAPVAGDRAGAARGDAGVAVLPVLWGRAHDLGGGCGAPPPGGRTREGRGGARSAAWDSS